MTLIYTYALMDFSVARWSREKAVFKCTMLHDFAHQAVVEHNQEHE